jgi:hypothetical protein
MMPVFPAHLFRMTPVDWDGFINSTNNLTSIKKEFGYFTMELSSQPLKNSLKQFVDPLLEGLDNWKYYVFIFVYFTILLFIAQLYLYFIYLNVNTAIFDFISLNSQHITISTIYLNNFFSINLSKTFSQNIVGCITNLVLMWFGLLLFFLTNRERKHLFFIHIFLIIFFVAPLLISLVNVELIQVFSIEIITGFSGIASTVVGYGVYSLLKFLQEQRMDADTPEELKIYLVALMWVFPLVCFVLTTVAMNLPALHFVMDYGLVQGVVATITRTDILAHITGFFLGLIFPFVLNPVISPMLPAR